MTYSFTIALKSSASGSGKLDRTGAVAQNEFGDILSDMPAELAVTVQAAGRAYSDGELDKVKTICKQALKKYRYNHTLLVFLARVYFKERNYPLAQFFINYAGPPKTYNEHLLYADILSTPNGTDKAAAQRIWEKACALSPSPAEALGHLAVLEADNGNLARAEELAGKCLMSDSNCYLGFYAKGKVLHARQAYPEALECLHNSLAQNPAFVPAMEEMARIFIVQKDIAAAKRILQQAVNIDRSAIFPIRKLAELHFMDSDYAAAEPLLTEILDVSPHDAGIGRLYYEMLRRQNRTAEAQTARETLAVKSYAIEKNIPQFIDKDFLPLLYRHRNHTMLKWDALYSNFTAARYIARNHIPGDVVECGVLEGGSAFLMAETLKLFGATDKKVYFYDTFEGMNEPTEKDVWVADNAISAADHYFEGFGKARYNVFLEGLNRVDYPRNRMIIVKGKVEDTIPGTIPEQISLLRLDTDWYESTMHEMVHLYPRLVQGGILICDDYGCWQGAREAMDEYCKKHDLRLYFHTNSIQGAIIAVKY